MTTMTDSNIEIVELIKENEILKKFLESEVRDSLMEYFDTPFYKRFLV